MIAAAQGRTRNASITDLTELKFGVRVDQVGSLLDDFQTAKQWYSDKTKQAFVSHREYLHDAVFVVGIESDVDTLNEISRSLQFPYFPIGLGRRACVPELPLVLGMRETDLKSALKSEPWQAKTWYRLLAERQHASGPYFLELVIDSSADDPQAFTIDDVPISYSPVYREYAKRFVTNYIHGVDAFELDRESRVFVSEPTSDADIVIDERVEIKYYDHNSITKGTDTQHNALMELDLEQKFLEED
jgi:CRISPR system Cascade subunit CasD